MQAQYAADAESWSSEQASLQADLASLAAQTALKSLALDAMLRAGNTGFASAGHAVDGPLWQQVPLAPPRMFPQASHQQTPRPDKQLTC